MTQVREKRGIKQDGITGTLWRATSEGSNGLTYFTHPAWLPDSSGLVFTSDRYGRREAHLLEWPGGNITRITEGVAGHPVVSMDGESILFIRSGRVLRQALGGGRPEEIGVLPGTRKFGQVGQTCDGKYLVVSCNMSSESLLVKFPRGGGDYSVFHRDPRHLSHLLPLPSDPELLSVAWTRWGGGEMPQRIWLTDLAKGGTRPLYDQPEGELVTHEAWSGDGRWLGFTAGPFDRKQGTFSLKLIDPRGRKTVDVADGGNFWHCCPNRDGSIIVSDTNWPDEGIQLVDSSSGEVETLCLSMSSIDTHPHPRFSPDGERVAFTSDVSGKSQVYVVELP